MKADLSMELLRARIQAWFQVFVLKPVVTFRSRAAAIPFKRAPRLHNLGRRSRQLQLAVIDGIPTQKRKTKRVAAHEYFPVMKPNSAGIDIGATEIFVAVPPDRDAQPVRSFLTFTEDLHRLADWLRCCQVDAVAMESTGVYWIPLFQILESRGFEVCLVNARHFQNVPGRKTDVSDCQWLRHLLAVGLLRGSFRPADEVCVLRSLLRHRDGLIQMASTHVLRMRKALDQMNLQIHHVISDITGLTGLKIMDAVLEGERDPKVLAGLRDGRIKAAPTGTVRR